MKQPNVFSKVGFFVKDFFAHWNTPPPPDYHPPHKEFVSYAVGGMGVQGMGILTQYFAINVGVHLSVVYNFDQMIVFYTTLIVSILSLFRAPLVGWIIDNTNTKWGKYRPYLLFTGLACVVSFWLLAFIPNIFMPGEGEVYTTTAKWLVIGSYQLIYFVAMTVFSFFSFGRTGLAQVITPNTNERTKLYSVGGVVDSLGPSIVQMLFPLIANGVYGPKGFLYSDQYGGMTGDELSATGVMFGMENIHTYQIIFPIFGCICVAVALIMFFGTKERLIQEKKVKEKIGFFTGIRKSFQNKYFWIFNISNVLAFGRLLAFSSVAYICSYMIGGNLGGTLRGLMPTVMAVGFVPGMLFSPLIQKKMGKKNMTLLSFAGSSILSALFLLLALVAFKSSITPWLMFLLIFLHNVFAALYTVTSPAMTADYCEYQQWKTGDRLDGFMNQYSTVLTTVCGMGSGYLVSYILVKFANAPDASSYANEKVLRYVFIIWGTLGTICGLLAMIPFFFWDLTEKKQFEMTKELRRRALTQDIADNLLEENDVNEALELGLLTREAAIAMGFEAILEQSANPSKQGVEPVAEQLSDEVQNCTETQNAESSDPTDE